MNQLASVLAGWRHAHTRRRLDRALPERAPGGAGRGRLSRMRHGRQPPVEVGPFGAPALFSLLRLFWMFGVFWFSVVMAMNESGAMTIITRLPSESFARTMNDEGMILMSVNPALLRSLRKVWVKCMFESALGIEL
jgi:hypothetical protein